MLCAPLILLFITPTLFAFRTGDQLKSFDISTYSGCPEDYCESTGQCFTSGHSFLCLCDNGEYNLNATCKCHTHRRCGLGECYDIKNFPHKYMCICPTGDRFRLECGNTICERQGMELCRKGKCINTDTEDGYVCECPGGSFGKSCYDLETFMEVRWGKKCLTDPSDKLCPAYFNRSWIDYERGFEHEDEFGYSYWRGLNLMSDRTMSGRFNLIVEVEHNETHRNNQEQRQGVFRARYFNVKVGPASQNFRLTFSGYDPSSSMNDTLLYNNSKTFNVNGMYFSTPDRDNDQWVYHCASDGKMGFWFNKCTAFWAMRPDEKMYFAFQFGTYITVKRARLLLEHAGNCP